VFYLKEEAATECLVNRIFDILSSLKATYDNAFIVAWEDSKPLDADMTKSIIVKWLERFGEQEGVKVLATSTIDILATIIADFHGHLKDISEVTKQKPSHAIA